MKNSKKIPEKKINLNFEVSYKKILKPNALKRIN